MKILKLILENFSSIDTAMKTKRIEIDFSNATNKICLIIGKNGSGKTSILSLLNPFATIGNLDTRNDLNLILEGKNGYKEIWIECDGDTYIIKHFYTPNKTGSHSVKSYIMKNDTELNVNGNVTSFKEIIKNELGIELDYLKLIRIGSNVTSMISLSETERKNFMSKLLDEIGIYLTYYKKVNNDLKQLKEMISHVIDKLNRLHIENKKDITNEIASLNLNKDSEKLNYDTISGRISVLTHEINEIEDTETLKIRLNSARKQLEKMEVILSKKGELESTDAEYYRDKIKELEFEVANCTANINACNLIIQNYIMTIDNLRNQYHDFEIQYEKEKNNDQEIEKMIKEKRKLEEEIATGEHNLKDFNPLFSKRELEDFIIYLKNTQQILSKTYEVGKKPIQKVIHLLRKEKNVTSYINNKLLLSNDNDELALFIHRLAQLGLTKEVIEEEKPCKDYNCTFKRVSTQLYNMLNTRDIDDTKEDSEFLHAMNMAWENIKMVFSSFSNQKNIIDRLPEKYRKDFSTDIIYNRIENLDFIYNDSKLNDLLSLITEYENYQDSISSLKSLEGMIKQYEKFSSTGYIINHMDELQKQIEEALEARKIRKDQISENNEIIAQDNKTLETYNDYLDAFEKYDTIKTEYDKLNKEWELYSSNREEIRNLSIDLNKSNSMIQYYEDNIQRLTTMLSQYNDYKTDLNKFNKVYDEMTLVKEALSSKKGIPLHYILAYLGDVEETTNELLDIAYGGNIYIDNFNITPTEFSIPFFNRGKRLRDVKYASQGELSFLSIALSFALSSRALKKYNIMLLDEIDGPLDTTNREKFIQILENQIDRIDSEQNFLITHNDMFASYPVDIIDLSFGEREKEYPLANFILVKKQ